MLGVSHSSGLGDPGPVQWPLALCLMLTWILVFLCVLKGIRSSGKVRGNAWGQQGGHASRARPSQAKPSHALAQVLYFTATFPYLVILILIIHGATLKGSLDGVRFYLSSDWKELQSAQVTLRRDQGSARWQQYPLSRGRVGSPAVLPTPSCPRCGVMQPHRSSTRWASASGHCAP